jgi:hypothetical protein
MDGSNGAFFYGMCGSWEILAAGLFNMEGCTMAILSTQLIGMVSSSVLFVSVIKRDFPGLCSMGKSLFFSIDIMGSLV